MTETNFLQQTPSGQVPFKTYGRSTELVLAEAARRGYTFHQIPDTGLFEISNGQTTRIYKPQIPTLTNHTGFYLAGNKIATKRVLERAGISVSKAYFIHKDTFSPQLAAEAFGALTKPLVVKPNDLTQGTNVFMGIQNLEELNQACQTCLKDTVGEDSGLVIEEQFTGKEYRVLATPDKVLSVVYRIPANVTGDGSSTIQQLIEKKNSDPRRHENPNAALVTIKIDEPLHHQLKALNLTLDSVPAKDERVFLRSNSNISTGGDSIELTAKVHPSVIEIARKVMSCLPGLALAGIDFMTTDIESPQTKDTYIILEVNASPGISVHQEPFEGPSVDTASIFLDLLFK